MRRAMLIGVAVICALALPAAVPAQQTHNDTSATHKAKKFYPGVYSEVEKKMLDAVGREGPMGPPPSAGKHALPPAAMPGNGKAAPPTMSTDAPMPMTADPTFMKMYANAYDYWNPLFNDEEYAEKTRYRGIIGVPFFKEPGGMFPTLGPNPEIGAWNGTNDGGDVEFYLPVRPGDVFHAEQNAPTVQDVTPAEGSYTRTFALTGSATLYNQKGEKVMTGTMYGRNMFNAFGESGRGGGNPDAQRGTRPPSGGPPLDDQQEMRQGGEPPDGMSPGGGPPPGGQNGMRQGGERPDGMPPGGGPPPDEQGGMASGEQSQAGTQRPTHQGTNPGGMPGGQGAPGFGTARHTYTADDWEKIHKIESDEIVRGAQVRYWEDVKEGDEPARTIVGPTTTLDMVQCFGLQIIQSPPMREQLKNKDHLVGLKQDQYGVYHLMEEGHFSEAGMGGNMPIFYMAYGRSLMVRLLTNWAGDDGWLRKFSWRNGSLADNIIAPVPSLHGKSVTGHGKVSDVLIARGYVTRKYLDGREHKVDLVVWTEDFDGTLCQAATATVILMSRGK